MGKWEAVDIGGIKASKISHDNYHGTFSVVSAKSAKRKKVGDDNKKEAAINKSSKNGSAVKPVENDTPEKPGSTDVPAKLGKSGAFKKPVDSSVSAEAAIGNNVQKGQLEGSSPVDEIKKPESPKPLSRRQKKNRKKRRRKAEEEAKRLKKLKKARKGNRRVKPPIVLNWELDLSAWDGLKLDERLIKGIRRLSFGRPTPIQTLMISKAIHGMDIFGAAETGSGKTLAFCLPILQKLLQNLNTEERKGPRALMLAPTRELALQINNQLREVAEYCDIVTGTLVGGMNIYKQQRILKSKPHVIVVTPGRLNQFLREKHEYLSNFGELQYLVLDEADRLVTQGTSEKILQDILTRVRDAWDIHELPTLDEFMASDSEDEPERKKFERQTFVTSATLTLDFKGVDQMAVEQLKRMVTWIPFRDDGIVIDLSSKMIVPLTLTQYCQHVHEDHEKGAYLVYFIKSTVVKTIVFVNAISRVKKITRALRQLYDQVWPIHAKMEQRQRFKSLDKFKASKAGVLVCTDVVGRGIDVKEVELIIHYDLPHTAETYIHRVGRTARAGSEGTSVALCSFPERTMIRQICKILKVHNLQKPVIDPRLHSISKKCFRVARRLNFLVKEKEERQRKKSWRRKWKRETGAGSDESGDEDEDKPKKFVYEKDHDIDEYRYELEELKNEIRLGT